MSKIKENIVRKQANEILMTLNKWDKTDPGLQATACFWAGYNIIKQCKLTVKGKQATTKEQIDFYNYLTQITLMLDKEALKCLNKDFDEEVTKTTNIYQ